MRIVVQKACKSKAMKISYQLQIAKYHKNKGTYVHIYVCRMQKYSINYKYAKTADFEKRRAK